MSAAVKLEPWQVAWAQAARLGDALVFATGVLGFLMPREPNPDNKPQLEPWQVKALEKFSAAWRDRFKRPGRLSIRSGHGVGKTAFLSITVLFVLLCGGPDTKIPIVANSQDQLRDGLWPEIAKWIRELPPPLRENVEWAKERVFIKSDPEGAFAVARTASKHRPEALQGIHARTVLAIFEEASGIPEETIEAGAGALSTPGAMAIAVGNPTRASGFFHATHTRLRAEWETMVVSSEDVPRAQGHIQTIVNLYGKGSNKYRVRVQGEFPTADDDTVIPLELVEAAKGRQVKPLAYRPVWGVDVGRFGDDDSTLIKRAANVLLEPPRCWHGLDTVQLSGRIVAELEATPSDMWPSEVCVDVIGIGAGVVDHLVRVARLQQVYGITVRAVNVAEKSPDDDCMRLRDWLWFRGRKWFEQGDCVLPVTGVERLISELTTVTYDFTVNGKRVVESKDDMKKRGLSSPNEADGLLLTFAATPVPRKKEADRWAAESGRTGWTG
jgi:hypothetical protein